MQNNIDRAVQFMPFDALKGFREALEQVEKFTEDKKEFCDDYDNLKRIFTNYLVIKNNKILGKTNISPVKRVNLLESGKIKKRKK